MNQAVYQRHSQGIGIRKLDNSPTTKIRHRMPQPVPTKSKLSVPLTFRQSQRKKNFIAQAQPMIVRNDRPSSRDQPRTPQKLPVNLSCTDPSSDPTFSTSQQMMR